MKSPLTSVEAGDGGNGVPTGAAVGGNGVPTGAAVGGNGVPTGAAVGGDGVPTEQVIQSGRIGGKFPVGWERALILFNI